MKTRLIIAGLLICSLIGAASGQRRPIRLIELQDDESGNHFVFDTSGNYVFTNCEDGIKFEGTATVKISGCTITLDGLTKFRLVQAEVDICKRTGKASLMQEDGSCPSGGPCEPQQWTVVDSNTANNGAGCGK